MHSNNPLTQTVNFYISVMFIASFGLIVALSVIQSLNPAATILQHVSSPITLDSAF